MVTITLKELHAKTGEEVRKAASSREPVGITDRGKLIAVLAPPHAVVMPRPKRILIPGYKAMMEKMQSTDVLDDLNAVREDRI